MNSELIFGVLLTLFCISIDVQGQESTPECYTPDGLSGKCINIFKCPHLANMMKPPLSRPDNLGYVKNSKCTSSDPMSVCCGAPRVLIDESNTKCTGSLTAHPPDPSSTCCGRDARFGDRISGGNKTSVLDYPWLVLIEYSEKGEKGEKVKTLCGGALISGRYVLTAAHCVTGEILTYGTPKNVRFSEYDTSNPGKDFSVAAGGGYDYNDGIVTIGIEDIILHPDQYSKQSKNDIALIRMKQFVPYTDFIRPICLPTKDDTRDPPKKFTMFAAGWGAVSKNQPSSAIKLHVNLPFVPQKDCQDTYRTFDRDVKLWEHQMCAGGELGKDSCRGDSGGPLMYENPVTKAFEVLGVVSFGPNQCGIPGVPGVYTKVIDYNDWIRSTIKN